jgi:hypothetical protein
LLKSITAKHIQDTITINSLPQPNQGTQPSETQEHRSRPHLCKKNNAYSSKKLHLYTDYKPHTRETYTRRQLQNQLVTTTAPARQTPGKNIVDLTPSKNKVSESSSRTKIVIQCSPQYKFTTDSQSATKKNLEKNKLFYHDQLVILSKFL